MATYGQNPDIDGSAETLIVGGASTPVSYGTVVKAHPSNSGIVYIGLTSGVLTTTGYPLAAGDEMFISKAEASDANLIYAIGSTTNQVAAYRAI